jgi:replicative DNA helicase
MDILNKEEFYFGDHKLIYDAIVRSYKEHKDTQISRLVSYLEETNIKDTED